MMGKYPVVHILSILTGAFLTFSAAAAIRDYIHATFPIESVVHAYCAEANQDGSHNLTLMVESAPSTYCIRHRFDMVEPAKRDGVPLYLPTGYAINGRGTGRPGLFELGYSIRPRESGPMVLHTRFDYSCPLIEVLHKEYLAMMPRRKIVVAEGETTFGAFSPVLGNRFSCGAVTIPAGPVDARFMAPEQPHMESVVR